MLYFCEQDNALTGVKGHLAAHEVNNTQEKKLFETHQVALKSIVFNRFTHLKMLPSGLAAHPQFYIAHVPIVYLLDIKLRENHQL